MEKIKKVAKFLASMRFAIILLVILAAACTVGSLVTQGQTYEWYAAAYTERRAALIMALHLDDAFHSWWFILITAFLCLNLMTCNLVRLPQLIRRYRAEGEAGTILKTRPSVEAGPLEDPMTAFATLHMPKPRQTVTEEGKKALVSSKNRVGLWGAWVCHLGILLLILGFGLGQMTKETYAVYGAAGQTKMIGNTGLSLTIDDFQVDLREDDTVSQYTAWITVRDLSGGEEGRTESAKIAVNAPATLFGMKFYQNSTGWAANMTISKEGEELQKSVVCAGDYLVVEDKPDLVIYFNALYPDLVMTDSGPATASSALKNPGYLYSVYYQEQILGMNVLKEGEVIKIDDYEVTLDQPQYYTVIQIKKDPFTWLAFAGGMITMIGLILAFYLLPSKVWAVKEEKGWMIYGEARKGGTLFRDRFKKALEKGDKDEHADASN